MTPLDTSMAGARSRSSDVTASFVTLVALAWSGLALAGREADAPDAFPSSGPLAPLVTRPLSMCGEAWVGDRAIGYGHAAHEPCTHVIDCRLEGLATPVTLPTTQNVCRPLELAIDETADLAYVLDDSMLVVLAFRPSDGALVPVSPRVIERKLAAPRGWRLGCAIGIVIALAAFASRRRVDADRAAVLDAIALSSALLGAVPLATWLVATRA